MKPMRLVQLTVAVLATSGMSACLANTVTATGGNADATASSPLTHASSATPTGGSSCGAEGSRICTSPANYLVCQSAGWSPAQACPIDSKCYQGDCVPDIKLDCNALPPFQACGGAVEGRWTISSSCLTPSTNVCPTIHIDVWGSLTIGANHRVTHSDIDSRSTKTFPAHCPNFDLSCRTNFGPLPASTGPHADPEGSGDRSMNMLRPRHCKLDSLACVCTTENDVSVIAEKELPKEMYCRRGNVLDIASGLSRMRLVFDP